MDHSRFATARPSVESSQMDEVEVVPEDVEAVQKRRRRPRQCRRSPLLCQSSARQQEVSRALVEPGHLGGAGVRPVAEPDEDPALSAA